MPAVITDIRFLKNNPGRVKIYLDHQFAFTLRILEAAQLEKGQILTDQQVRQFKHTSDCYEAYRSALKYLSYRPRSRKEVGCQLRKKGLPEDIVSKTLERLTNEKLLDDVAFAGFWLNRHQKRAAAVLRYELKKKGIEEPVISTVLSQVDDGAEAQKIVDRKLYRKWAHLPPEDMKKSLVNYLRRRGYSTDVAFGAYRYACEKLDQE